MIYKYFTSVNETILRIDLKQMNIIEKFKSVKVVLLTKSFFVASFLYL